MTDETAEMKMTAATATAVARWFEEIAIYANDALYLNSDPVSGKWSVTDGAGGPCTMINDWGVVLEADTLDALAEMMARDLRLS